MKMFFRFVFRFNLSW